MRGAASRRIGAAAGLAIVCAVAGLAGLGAAAPAAAAREPQKLLDGTVRFLEEHQLESGAYADSGKKPTQSISAWVTLALATAGVNPRDQTRFVGGAACGHSALQDLEEHFAASAHEEIAYPQVATTAYERELLVVDAAGADPHDFAGQDLVAKIIERQGADGGIPFVPGGEAQVNDSVFGILALAPVREPAAEEAVRKAGEWLVRQGQDEDGGFNWRMPGSASEVDLTGAAIEALVAAGSPGSEVEAKALEFLHTSQRPDGGFAEFPGTEGESNVASTAWGVQGIWASGGNPEAWRTGAEASGPEPLGYMESMQQADGHVRWRASSDLNGIWMTAYVMPAFAGRVLPYARVPLSGTGEEPLPPCGETPPVPAAPPGGARKRHARDEEARDHARTRRGTNLEQARGTESREPRRGSEADQEAKAVSAASVPSSSGGEGGGDEGEGSGERGAALSTAGAQRAGAGSSGAEIRGFLIGSPDGKGGKLAFGAPGLRSADRGGDEEPWVPLAIAAAALALLALGARRERRGGRPKVRLPDDRTTAGGGGGRFA